MTTCAQGSHRNTGRGMAVLGLVLVTCLLAVAAFRFAGHQPREVSYRDAVASARLGFSDLGAGTVRIYDWDRGIELDTLAAGEGSFIRGVLRSLVRERRARGLVTEDPFTLLQYPDGSLVLEDPLTDERIELWAFGPANAGVFAALLSASLAAS